MDVLNSFLFWSRDPERSEGPLYFVFVFCQRQGTPLRFRSKPETPLRHSTRVKAQAPQPRRLRFSCKSKTNPSRSASGARPIASSSHRQCVSCPPGSACVCEVSSRALRRRYSCCPWGGLFLCFLRMPSCQLAARAPVAASISEHRSQQ